MSQPKPSNDPLVLPTTGDAFASFKKAAEMHRNGSREFAQVSQPMQLDLTWTERGSGFEFETGKMRLVVTDQRDRSCGWCWHVHADHAYGSDSIGQGGYLPSADAAKRAAIAWARAFCEQTLTALTHADAVL